MADAPPEPIAPYVLRLVRPTDVLVPLTEALEDPPIEWWPATVHSIASRGDGLYEVLTDAGSLHTRWVFDSACEVAPTFPSPHRPRAVLSGTGLRIEADRPVFDASTATLFDPLDKQSFAYLLPLSLAEALLESACFGPTGIGEDRETLLQYLYAKYPEADFTVTHSEYGSIPLGFAPVRTTGPRHVLIGAKRGLIKSSAGYGVARIAPPEASAWASCTGNSGRCRQPGELPSRGVCSMQDSCGSPPRTPGYRWLCSAASCGPFHTPSR